MENANDNDKKDINGPQNADPDEFFHLSIEDQEVDMSERSQDSGTEKVTGIPTDTEMEPFSLETLGVKFVEQNSLERTVAEQADKAIAEKSVELEKKRLERALKKLYQLQGKVRSLRSRLDTSYARISEKDRVRHHIDDLEKGDLIQAVTDVKEIRERLHQAEVSIRSQSSTLRGNVEKDESPGKDVTSTDRVKRLPDETQQEYLIRTGKVTAFGSANGFIEEIDDDNEADKVPLPSHQNLHVPGLDDVSKEVKEENNESQRTGLLEKSVLDNSEGDSHDDADYEEPFGIGESGDEYEEDNSTVDDDDIDVSKPHKEGEDEDFKNIDDGEEEVFQRRLTQWTAKRSSLRTLKRPDYVDDLDKPEWEKPHPVSNDAILNDEFHVPGDIYPALFDYQKTGVQWLWELYSQRTGGIVGDEMGLGKTVQVIAFLAGLHYSRKLTKPVLVVCPATVLSQWCNEFHRWWPAFRTMILHSIGSGMSTKKRTHGDLGSEEERWDENLEDEGYGGHERSSHSIMNEHNAKELIRKVIKDGHVIITTYVGVRIYAKYLLPVHWEYVVLDEGHKIRNPDSYITLTCKQLKTHNRVILSGTPIQNNLVELWSLFDFIFPGRLGTLPVFQKQFCIPINLGGYANATNVQVQAGYKCAVILKDLISPYLLRRVKADVAQDLPKKSEMVLFCELTRRQRTMYENFLHSEDLQRILKGKRNALYGIDVLRKICNHPDLVISMDSKKAATKEKPQYKTSAELSELSGKLHVVSMLLRLWNKEDRKALLFTQTRQMLNIFQDFMEKLNQETGNTYGYLRMDGTTPISERQKLVDSFNNNPKYKVFLLTTRVGGLGINLTGASRVIIYDPDWNPSTDIQARERAWRLGQKKDVTIYRLMVAGSIEEKIYHRQIFKQFLTNKILKDPKQKRFFKMTDMYDLFTLGDQDTKGTETADLFGARETNYQGSKERKSRYLSGVRRKGHKSTSSEKDVDSDDFLAVSQMKGVASIQEYDTGEGSKPKGGNGNDDDIGLVSQIFKRSGVHSALEHDSILGRPEGSSFVGAIESEANRIARDAVEALRDSRKVARRSSVGVPTWTGRFGSAGRKINMRPTGGQRFKRKILPGHSDSSRGRNASTGVAITHGSSSLSSYSILQSMENKSKDVGTLRPIDGRISRRSPSSTGAVDDSKKTKDLITRLSGYLAGVKDYFSTSSEILDHLNIDVSDEKEVKILRSMLRSICKWDKVKRGWVLNEEFR
ncbi:hypothetical protein FOA43_003908 [Brettanomyces nanus]|uniref:DNA excision repair protein ERCC-6 n=1 Tax=Eeniella nana TaxID=13502 RepID=A0A875SAA7_EENNA|nr:uncharacterized protein FOA43_003908 [Brettanomyces nanus]QPG76519.1 hypothetical protein FOA43_003908 [Brettanomyces nanus]